MTRKKKDCGWCKPIIIITLILTCMIFLKVFVGVYYVDREVIKYYDNNRFLQPCIELDTNIDNCVCVNVEYQDNWNNKRLCSWNEEVQCSCRQTIKNMKLKFK